MFDDDADVTPFKTVTSSPLWHLKHNQVPFVCDACLPSSPHPFRFAVHVRIELIVARCPLPLPKSLFLSLSPPVSIVSPRENGRRASNSESSRSLSVWKCKSIPNVLGNSVSLRILLLNGGLSIRVGCVFGVFPTRSRSASLCRVIILSFPFFALFAKDSTFLHFFPNLQGALYFLAR